MNSNVNSQKILLALKRAIEKTFSSSHWEELSLDTDCVEIIQQYPRLLESLSWGDPDYREMVTIVLRKIIEKNPDNITVIENFVSLEKWLEEHEPRLHKELYEEDSIIV